MYLFYLVTMLLSLAGIIFVLWTKIIEMRTGETGLFSRLSVFSDPVLRQWIEKIKFFLSRFNVASVRKVFITGEHSLFHIFGTVGLFVSKYYGLFSNRLNGKRNLSGGGVVSFFLKNVAESEEKKERKDL